MSRKKQNVISGQIDFFSLISDGNAAVTEKSAEIQNTHEQSSLVDMADSLSRRNTDTEKYNLENSEPLVSENEPYISQNAEVLDNDEEEPAPASSEIINFFDYFNIQPGTAQHIEKSEQSKNDENAVKPFAKMRCGNVRVLVGSTAKMGTGVNVQDRLYALHHCDVPWRPADLQQRDGRILRQWNKNPFVRIYHYVTKNTFDSFNWQIVEQRLRAEYAAAINEYHRRPTKAESFEIVSKVYAKIEDAEIWIPFGEVLRYYRSKQNKFYNSLLRRSEYTDA